MRTILFLLLTLYALDSSAQQSWSFTFPDNNTVKVNDLEEFPKKIDTNFVKGHLNPTSFVQLDSPLNMQLNTIEKLKEKNVYRLKVKIMPKDPTTEQVLKWRGYRFYILTVTKKGRSFIEYAGTEI